MQWDLGPRGIGTLVVMALAFGVIARLITGKARGGSDLSGLAQLIRNTVCLSR